MDNYKHLVTFDHCSLLDQRTRGTSDGIYQSVHNMRTIIVHGQNLGEPDGSKVQTAIKLKTIYVGLRQSNKGMTNSSAYFICWYDQRFIVHFTVY